jgi:hypothetical protein
MSTTPPPPCRRSLFRLRPPRMWLCSCAGLALLTLSSGATPPARNAPPVPPPAAPQLVAAAPESAPAEAPANPMDEAIRILTEARKVYATVQDYTCVLIKKEKMGDQPAVENVMVMKVRTAPFGVNLRWMEPKSLAGQEAVYVAGKNDGKMRVRSAGVLGAVGFVSLDLNDARAKETSKHSIAEAGIGNLLDRYAAGWERERRWRLTEVQVAEYEYNKRRCLRVETTHPTNPDGRFLFFRNVTYFDKETKLPIRVECYDWPRREGAAAELVEVYSYVNMKLNVGLADDVFNK